MANLETIKCEACNGTGKRKGTRQHSALRNYPDMRKNQKCMECLGNGTIQRRIRKTAVNT